MRIKERKDNLLRILEKTYPEAKSELHFKNPYELLIAVVLSAQCTDKKVNEVTPALFEKYPTFRDLSAARLKDVEAIIRQVNYYKTKSKNIIETAKIVTSQHGGNVPLVRKELTSLAGVGQKTANVVLGELGAEQTFPVDTHVFRLAKRLGLAHGKNVKEVEEELKLQFPPETWRNLHHWLIFHGRRICKAQSPECGACPLNEICPSAECGK